MMVMKRIFSLPNIFIISLLSSSLSGQDLTLEQLLSRMDDAGEKLKTMVADIEQKKWTELLKEFDQGESGKIYFMKGQDGISIRREITQPSPHTLVIRKGEVLYYEPVIKQAQRHNLGRHQDKAEYLLLGYGADKQALEDSYETALLGQEVLDGTQIYKLELKPRSSKAAAFFPRILLWIDAERFIPIQQKLFEPTDDYLLVRFKNIQVNADISKDRFKVDLPDDVRVIQ